MILPDYVFLAPNASVPQMGSGFVLHTKKPYELGRIVKLKPGPYAIISYVNEFKPLIYAEVPGYSVLIVFAGRLDGNKVTVNGQNWESELQKIFNQMADWYLEEKINRNLNYYKRYINE